MPSFAATASASIMILRTRAHTSGIADHLGKRGAGQRADRIEGDVAQKLDPDFVADARGERAAEAGFDQRFGDGAAALGARTIGLAERDAVAFVVADHAGLDDVGGEIDDGAEDVSARDGLRDDAAGVDSFQADGVSGKYHQGMPFCVLTTVVFSANERRRLAGRAASGRGPSRPERSRRPGRLRADRR